MASSSRSVIFDMADTTTTTGRFACSCCTMRAATRMRSAEPMLVPPNFMMSRSLKSLMALVLPPVGNAGAHQFEDRFCHFILAQIRGIQIDCVRRLCQRRVGAGAIACVTLLHLRRQCALGDLDALGARFQRSEEHTSE